MKSKSSSDSSLHDTATAVVAKVQGFCDDTKICPDLLHSAATLYLRTLASENDAQPHWEVLAQSPARLKDVSVVMGALFESETAWKHVIDEVDTIRDFANNKFASVLGSMTDDAIDGVVDHLRAEAPSRRHAPAIRSRLATYRGSASLRTWLRTIVLNRLRDLRKETMELPETTASPTPNVDIQNEVQRAIEQLSPGDQVFARLVHIYGEAQSDVAELLKISPAAVSQRRKKIIDSLRSLLTGDSYSTPTHQEVPAR